MAPARGQSNGQRADDRTRRRARRSRARPRARLAWLRRPRVAAWPRLKAPSLGRRASHRRAPPAAVLPTIHGERMLAFAARRRSGAGGEELERPRHARKGEQAECGFGSPRAGRCPACARWTDGPGRPERGQIACPCAGRLVPPRDDWRGDDPGRHTRRRGAEADRDAAARSEGGQRRRARGAHDAGRPSPDALQMAVFAGVGQLRRIRPSTCSS